MMNSKENLPLISVIMPTYNHARYIKESVDSVLSQTYPALELIIIDNYSGDNTEEIVRSCNDPRLSYYKFANEGVIARSRNFAIERAKGEFIAFCDSDDLWQPEKLRLQIELFRREPGTDLVYCRRALILAGNKKYIRAFRDISTFDGLLLSNAIPCSSVMIKKEILLDHGSFDEDPFLTTFDDTELWLRLLQGGGKIRSLDQALISYRMHPSSTFRANRFRIITRNFYMCSKLLLKLGIADQPRFKVWLILLLKAIKTALGR